MFGRFASLGFGVAVAALIAAAPALTQPPSQNADPQSVGYAQTAEDRVVITGMVPVPKVGEGAPIYTSSDLEKIETAARREAVQDGADSRRCRGKIPTPYEELTLEGRFFLEAELGRRIISLADKAQVVTRAAEEARSGAATGKVSMAEVERTELARQEAVRLLEAARKELLEAESVTADLMWLKHRAGENPEEVELIGFQSELMRLAVKREKAGGATSVRPAPEFADLKVVNVSAVQKTDRKGESLLLVSGQIVNTRAHEIAIPPLTIMAVDEQGWPLMNRTADPNSHRKIPPGGTMGFSYELKPKPGTTRTVAVTFASKSKSTMQLPVGLFCSKTG